MLSSRLEDILQNEIHHSSSANDESVISQSQVDNEIEDFFQITSNESREGDCPNALKIVACQLLFEITTYLRETHQYLLSKSSSRRTSVATKDNIVTVEPILKHPPNTNRRWSMALSNVNYKDNSAHSLISLSNMIGPSVHYLDHSNIPPERRISFVLHEADIENESGNLIGSNGKIDCMINLFLRFFLSKFFSKKK